MTAAQQIETETIINLEHRFWTCIQERDNKGAAALLAPESIVAGAQGASIITPELYGKMAQQGESLYQLKSYRLEDPKVTFPAKGVAVIAYKVTEEMDVEGKPLTLNAADTTVWVQVSGEWRAALHTESLLGDPFGRNRKQ